LSSSISDISLQRPTWAEISLDNIDSNFQAVQRMAPKSGVMAVVKADGYGHGAVVIAQELEKSGTAFLGIATAAEAAELMEAGIRIPIVVMGGISPAEIPLLRDYPFIPAVHNQEMLSALQQFGVGQDRRIKVHIKVDTGMGRLGMSMDDAAMAMMRSYSALEIEGLFTHFASADVPNDPYTKNQIQKFNEFVAQYGKGIRYKHAANSAAVLNYPEAHYDLVRPGLLLYGLSPMGGDGGLKPVLSLKSKITALRTIEPGETIGYSRNFKAERRSLIATIPIGYSDGLRRRLSNRLQVEVQGAMCRIVGNISMDLCMIDVTDIADRVHLYDTVTLIGPKTSAWDWANLLDSIPWEVLCLIGARVPRVYYRGDKMVDVYYP